ncbi:MAG TPA: nitrous oxide-stimulated promoter family protein [Tepidisphaeraceae bacterium]
MEKELRKDLRTLGLFIDLYCKYRHADAERLPVVLKTHDVKEITGRNVCLCPGCQKLLTHAFVKRSTCPMDPKPQCKHCPVHCYHPTYRAQIREVMKYSGKKMLLSGRLDYLFHLLF